MVRALDRALSRARGSPRRRCASRDAGRRCRSARSSSSWPRTTTTLSPATSTVTKSPGSGASSRPRDVDPLAEEHTLPVELVDLRGAVVAAGKRRPELTHLVPKHTNLLDTSCYVGLHCANTDLGGGRDASARTQDDQAPFPLRLGRHRRGALGRRRAAPGRGCARRATRRPGRPRRHPARASRAPGHVAALLRQRPDRVAASTTRRGRSTSSTGPTTSTPPS